MQEQLLEGQGSEIKCQGCEKGNPAVSKCVDCDYFLCTECQEGHKRWPSMKSHKIYVLAQLRSGETVYQSKLRQEVPKCSKHPDKNLSFYCNTCEVVACTTCSVLGHKKHSLIGLSEAFEQCKQDVAEMTAQAEEIITELDTALRQTEESGKKLDSMFAESSRKISQKADEEVAKKEMEINRIRQEINNIRDNEYYLKKEAEKLYKERARMYQTAQATNSREVSQSKSKLDEVNQLMSQASCCEILDLKQKVLNNLKEMMRKRPERVSDGLSFIDFQTGGKGSLGTLLLENKWELKTEINTFGPEQTDFKDALSVSAFSNNDIAVVDFNHEKLITYAFKPHCKPAATILSEAFTNTNISEKIIVANKDDRLVVLEGVRAKVLSRANQILHQFTLYNMTLLCDAPSCLAVDGNNQIAVGYSFSGEICLHNPEGFFIRRLPAPKIGFCLTTYKEHFIYAFLDMSTLHVQAVDYNGGKVFSSAANNDQLNIRGSTQCMLGLHGVCCDSDGSIYVSLICRGKGTSDPLQDRTGNILQFSADGKYLGCIIQESHPIFGITFTPAGDLVAATGSSVKIYHHL